MVLSLMWHLKLAFCSEYYYNTQNTTLCITATSEADSLVCHIIAKHA